MFTLTEDTWGVQVNVYDFNILYMHIYLNYLFSNAVLIPCTVDDSHIVLKRSQILI